MPRNARKEMDKILLDIALEEGTLVQRALVGVVSFVFLQPEDVPEYLQPELLDLQQQFVKVSSMTAGEVRIFVMQLVHLRNQLIEETAAFRQAG